MKPIELKCFFQDGMETELQELGIKRRPVSEQELRVVLLLNIDAIEPYIEEDITYSVIVSGANEYICHLPYEKLKRILLDNWNKENYKAI